MSEVIAQYFEDEDFDMPEKAPLQRVESTETVIAKKALSNTVEIKKAFIIPGAEDTPTAELERVQLTEDPMKDYLQAIGKYPLLTAEQEVEIGKAIEVGLFAGERKAQLLAQGTSENSQMIRELEELERIGVSANEKMINSNLRLVVSYGKGYFNRGLSELEVIQEGNIGLIHAVEKFDFAKGNKFSTYSTWWIKQSIGRAIADLSTEIRVPVRMHDLILGMKRLEWNAGKNGKVLSDREIADAMDTTTEKVKEFREFSKIRRPFSYNEKRGNEGDEEIGDIMPDTINPSPEELAEKDDIKKVISDVLDVLDEKERNVITLRYGIGGGRMYSLKEIAEIEKLSRQRIQQIEEKAMKKLRILHGYKDEIRQYLP
jgi:RNA polymerase primary sigma factor